MDELLRALDLEDSLPSTSKSQIEANKYRRNLLMLMNKPKPEYEAPEQYNNFAHELLLRRLADPDYRFNPRTLFND
ncbi:MULTISPECIES: hypothetical protein [Paenibacillus]|uniref:hypothetical protein n=1 Tax=Paenibacillus TaxID=44249 RepID=UPI000970149A|nr:hypothetical protein [Paenibacillus odorifer]OMC94459.1 hypothetical protein BJP49_15600 [Paenibacillus odorifer]